MFHRVLELFVISLRTNTTSSLGLKKQQNAISISKKKIFNINHINFLLKVKQFCSFLPLIMTELNERIPDQHKLSCKILLM